MKIGRLIFGNVWMQIVIVVVMGIFILALLITILPERPVDETGCSPIGSQECECSRDVAKRGLQFPKYKSGGFFTQKECWAWDSEKGESVRVW